MVNFLKVIDKLLKKLKTDRNTFCTYILTLVSAYLVVDRVVEMLMMIFTGMACTYWGPIGYTLAIACPVFAFLLSFSSKYADSDKTKLVFFDTYIVCIYLLVISMFVQFINQLGWMLFMSVPNFSYIAANFYTLIKPAFSAVALYLPLTTFFLVIKFLITFVHDNRQMLESIYEYKGISLADKSASWGDYTCELYFGLDKRNGTKVKLAEEKRFFPTLICGISGSGKTSLLFEPMIAQDLTKKYFFREVSKEMGFTALKAGIATLTCPYTSEYINSNFNLNMIKPKEGKENVYNTYFKKLIIAGAGDKYIYKNLGITYIAPDIESVNRMMKVAKAQKLKVNLIDPNDPTSVGVNPFVFDDPIQTAIAISTVLKGLYSSSAPDMTLAYRENAANQAVENLAILLKEMYPRLHNDDLPTLEDVLNCLTDFDLVVDLCEAMKQDSELAEKYTALIKYFERNFYPEASGRSDMEKFVTHASAQLDSLLRYSGVKNILCNRVNTVNFDKALSNGEITFICTRRGDLGPNIHQAFGLFCILMLQYSVLRRPGTEKDRVPHFFYVDEFSDFVGNVTDPLFTIYRKYKVSTVVSVQNLAQLDGADKKHRETITANCSNKFVFGNNTPEDNEWWSKEIGNEKRWQFGNSYDTAKGEYEPKLTGIKYGPEIRYKPGKLQSLKFKQALYKLKNLSGKFDNGIVILDFMSPKYNEEKNVKFYDFDKYNSGTPYTHDDDNKKKKNNLKHYHFDDNVDDEIDPINTDTADSKYLFDNEDAIVINFKKPNKNQ